MSQTQPVTCGSCGFWAYDVALGIFLKYLIDAAQANGRATEPWLSQALASWQVSAVISDVGLELDERWSEEQRNEFIALAEQVCAALTLRESISADEIRNWRFSDDLRIEIRGAREVFTAPIVELGQAVIELLRGALPKPPKGSAWLFGTPSGRTTIQMDPGWDGRW